MKTNIIISGVGGQGVITLGMLIAQSAMAQGENVVMSEIHGLAQRGGSVSVDVRIGDFHAPIVPDGDADLIIGLELLEAKRILHRAGKDTKVIVSTETMVPVSLSIRHEEYPPVEGIISSMSEKFHVRELDAVSIAREAGNYKAANVAVLGFAVGTGWLSLEISRITEELGHLFRGRAFEINMEALDMGMAAARSVEQAKS